MFEKEIITPENDTHKSKAEISDGPTKTTAITTSTVWEDLAVAIMNPQPQTRLEVSKGETLEAIEKENVLTEIAEEIFVRDVSGPNLKYTFLVMLTAIFSIVMVASSTTVKKSPILFRVLWCMAFAVNVISASIPGRLDRILVAGHHVKPWNTLFEASTWAFSLWSVIYTSETALSGYVTIIGIPIYLFQRLVPYWFAGNWFQALWCFSFRPEFKSRLWIPTLCLLLGALSLIAAHYEITLFIRHNCAKDDYGLKASLMIFRLPFAVHGSWLAAAALLNLNSYVAISKFHKSRQIAIAHITGYAGAAFGVAVALYSGK